MAKLIQFVLALSLLTLFSIQNVLGEIAPRLNAAVFEDGRSIWTFARYTNYTAYSMISGETAQDFKNMLSYTLPDLAYCYDANQKQLFSISDLPVVFTDENSLFLDLGSGDIAHMYIPLGSSKLNIQVYDKTGSPKGQNRVLFDVLTYSVAVSETQPAKILITYYIIEKDNTGSAMYTLLDDSGATVLNSTLIASKVFTVTTDRSYVQSIAASSTADGNFIVNWNAGLNNNGKNNNNLIRAAYIQPGKPITQAFIVAMSNTLGYLRVIKCGTLRAGDGHYCVYEYWGSGAAAVRSYASYITEFSFTGAR
ncbi:hypothetical protein K7432_008151 [Basidiobolus ranarum]|uniref:Uncharacterized protein n=1 Tax=Basidiobolus ranarum TaxID=34480 RepID=A0ABR2VZ14_9FUNG